MLRYGYSNEFLSSIILLISSTVPPMIVRRKVMTRGVTAREHGMRPGATVSHPARVARF